MRLKRISELDMNLTLASSRLVQFGPDAIFYVLEAEVFSCLDGGLINQPALIGEQGADAACDQQNEKAHQGGGGRPTPGPFAESFQSPRRASGDGLARLKAP